MFRGFICIRGTERIYSDACPGIEPRIPGTEGSRLALAPDCSPGLKHHLRLRHRLDHRLPSRPRWLTFPWGLGQVLPTFGIAPEAELHSFLLHLNCHIDCLVIMGTCIVVHWYSIAEENHGLSAGYRQSWPILTRSQPAHSQRGLDGVWGMFCRHSPGPLTANRSPNSCVRSVCDHVLLINFVKHRTSRPWPGDAKLIPEISPP